MKLKVRVKLINGQKLPHFIDKGEWVDLRANEYVTLKCPQARMLHRKKSTDTEETLKERTRDLEFNIQYIGLGVAMRLPEGFEAIIAPRSSTPKKYGFIVPNSFGVIDNSFSGNEDEWKMIAIPFKNATIERFDRICQFRIQLSQKATLWQKFKWLLSSGVEIVEVDNLDGPSRGGIGSTGTK